MRFLGPRSISSLLKTALDVVYYGLFVVVAVVFIAAVCLISVPSLSREMVHRFNLPGGGAAAQPVIMLAFGVSLSGYLLITHWTRQVFQTLAEGDAFHLDNTHRLRWIGFGLAGLEIFSYLTRFVAEGVFHLRFEPIYGLRAVTAWFSVLVVFVLAEVFREGARLRQEADLTI
jgi:hypothetical protein